MTKPEVAAPEVNCIGKDKHKSMSLAREIARRMSSRREEAIRAYKCPHCGYYHVGSQHSKGKFYGRPKR